MPKRQTEKSMEKICRAIDVGFGATKLTLNNGSDGEIKCMSFRSVCPVASDQQIGGFLSKRDTVILTVNGTRYEVGPDALLAMRSNASRNMEMEFPLTDQYMALVRAAMHYMDVPRLDYLFLGLPLSTYTALEKRLAAIMRGTHELQDRSIVVGACVVVPQPVGGMWDYAVRHRMVGEMQTTNTLVVDPGYMTLDWLVTSGTKMVPVRSSAANNCGMGAIVKAVGDSLVKKISERDRKPAELTEAMLSRIDHAIQENGQVMFDGKLEPLDDHMEAGTKIVRDGLQRMMQSVGSRSDIDNVIIVGGAAKVYEREVCAIFGEHRVRVSTSPVLANVRGFQMLANRKGQQV
jgi:plasmid segregation protein ParM